MMSCPRCGNTEPEGAQFCGRCGAPLQRQALAQIQGRVRYRRFLWAVFAVLLLAAAGGTATALVTATGDGASDKDNEGGGVHLVSSGSSQVPGNDESGLPSWSPDGSRIAFQSVATNLVRGLAPGFYSLVRGWPSGELQVLSASARVEPTQLSDHPWCSHVRIVFAYGEELSGDRLAIKNLADGSITKLGRTPDGSDALCGPDGQRITFSSRTDHLLPGAPWGGIFIKDLRTDDLSLVYASGRIEPRAYPEWSPDGERIAFCGRARDGHTSVLYVRDLSTRTLSVVAPISSAGGCGVDYAFSPDGQRIAFTSEFELTPTATGAEGQIYVKDLRTGAVTLASETPQGAPGNAQSFAPAWSPDGRRLAFSSYATNLVAGVRRAPPANVFIRNLSTGSMTLFARWASHPAWSPNGKWLLFEGAFSAPKTYAKTQILVKSAPKP